MKSSISLPVTPLVSVVIPTRNRKELLRRALDSVFAQTYTRLQVIVVDDASTDGTAAMLAALGDNRLLCLRHSQSRGGAAARNTGIQTTTGAVIGFLDDDDEWEANKVFEQLKVLRGCSAVICASNISGDLSRFEGKRTIDLADLRAGKFTAGGTGVLMLAAEVAKQTLFDESLPRYQDWDLFIRVAQQCQIAYLNKVLVRYNEGNHLRITNSLIECPQQELEQQFRMLYKHKEFFGRTWFRRHMSRALLYGVKHRSDKWKLLINVIRRYGPINVAVALGVRLKTVLGGRLTPWRLIARFAERRGAYGR